MTGELRGDRMKKIKNKNWKNIEEPSKETEVLDPTIFFCLMEKLPAKDFAAGGKIRSSVVLSSSIFEQYDPWREPQLNLSVHVLCIFWQYPPHSPRGKFFLHL
jgi:hypothetical protein